jgi:RNA polymerase sigma factor (sigma-70 family)
MTHPNRWMCASRWHERRELPYDRFPTVTVEALRQGRPEVLAELLERFGREIGGVAYLILRDRAAAEDVLMDTLVSALERGAHLRDPDALRAWLLRIATNHALGLKRRAARVVLLPSIPEAARVHIDPDIGERTMIWQGISELPPRMRAAIVLHYYADLPVDGVAAAMGVSPNTVKTQLRTALERLRAHFEASSAGQGVMEHA